MPDKPSYALVLSLFFISLLNGINMFAIARALGMIAIVLASLESQAANPTASSEVIGSGASNATSVPLPQSWSMVETLPPLGSSSQPIPPVQVDAEVSDAEEYVQRRPVGYQRDSSRLNDSSGVFREFTALMAIDGSKQPQDFGVNANLGVQSSFNWGLALLPSYGLGLQVGSGITATSNAVRVYELLGETSGRTQSFTTLGLFQRSESGWAWGVVHDFLYEKSFDDFQLGQWRARLSYDLTEDDTLGMTTMLRSYDDSGVFGTSTAVTLKPIDQANLFWRHFWNTGAQTTLWTGIAQGHGEDNIVTGPSASKDEQFLLGADVLMPLTARLAIYGETNLMMPADTGTVDAFLGVQWYPSGNVKNARRGRYSPMMSLASPTTFSVDLSRP